jgi:putative DNA primase/helicase
MMNVSVADLDAAEAAEVALRGLMTTDEDTLDHARDFLGSNDFPTPAHRSIANAIFSQAKQSDNLTPEAVTAQLIESGETDAAEFFKARVMPMPEPTRDDLVVAVNAVKVAEQIAKQLAAEFPLNEIGNGQRFAAANRADMRYCGVREKWLRFKNGYWQTDEDGTAEQRAKQIGQQIAAEAAAQPDDDKRARLLKHALTLTKRATRDTMLKDAASEDGMRTTPEQFDTNPDKFNCANGTLDLKTFEFCPHSAADLLTLRSPTNFDADATCPTWDACMARWIPNEATREYLQETVGVSLSGRIFEEFFNFLYGGGDNGKSTFMRQIETLCGTYWHKTQAETIMEARDKRDGNAPAPALLAMKGARLLTVQEIDSKHTLNAALFKDLTGRDAITARGLFEKRPTTFVPQFTPWMFGNGKPQIKDGSSGMWRRVRLIDFSQPIPASERDPHLSDKLAAELPGILNWALEGLRRVYERGLIVPDDVNTATAEYKAEQDAISGFIADCCVLAPNCEARAADLFEAWCRWCRDNGERQSSQRAFGLELKRRKFEKESARDGVKWFGIGIKADDDHHDDQPKNAKKAENTEKEAENTENVNLVNLVDDIPVKFSREDFRTETLPEIGSQGSQGSQKRETAKINGYGFD